MCDSRKLFKIIIFVLRDFLRRGLSCFWRIWIYFIELPATDVKILKAKARFRHAHSRLCQLVYTYRRTETSTQKWNKLLLAPNTYWYAQATNIISNYCSRESNTILRNPLLRFLIWNRSAILVFAIVLRADMRGELKVIISASN